MCIVAALVVSCVLVFTVGISDEEFSKMPRLFHLDDYEACLRPRSGLYCLGTLQVEEQQGSVYNLMKEYSLDPRHFDYRQLHRGYCVSSRCPHHSSEPNATLRFDLCARHWAQKRGLRVKLQTLHYCRTYEDVKKGISMDGPKQVFLAVVGILLVLNAAGTAYDLMTSGDKIDILKEYLDSEMDMREESAVKRRRNMAEEQVSDNSVDAEVEDSVADTSALLPDTRSTHQSGYALKVFQGGLNLLAHILIGVIVGTTIFFCCKGEMNATNIHIILCVLGYQLLMAEAILSLSSHNSWTSSLKLVDKRRAHWILQVAGSSLAIAGSFIKIVDKSVHWNSLHGKFALVALVFTIACLVNGITSLYAYQLRRVVPGALSKITHIVFGSVAFGSASISLIYGFNKNFFRKWASSELTAVIITFTAVLTLIIIVNPLVTIIDKTVRVFRR